MLFRILLCLLTMSSLLAANINNSIFTDTDKIASYFKMGSVAVIALAAGLNGYKYLKRRHANTNKKRIAKSHSIVFIFSHGIADTKKQALRYVRSYYQDYNTVVSNTHYIMDDPWIAFDYPDATTNFWRVNFIKMSLGQEADIATLKKAYLKTRKDYPNAEIVLIGLSRGASTIINFLAEHQPTHIKAVILESPFDTVAGVIDHFCKQANMASKPLLDMSQKILSWVSSYKPSGIQPIHTIHKIPSTIPVLFICSKEDRVVPASGTITLYETLRLSGHSKAHILILDQGKHGFLLTGPQAKIYQSTVHAFYKHYRLDHDPIMANFGMKYLHTFL